jgi:hypothetical protein
LTGAKRVASAQPALLAGASVQLPVIATVAVEAVVRPMLAAVTRVKSKHKN